MNVHWGQFSKIADRINDILYDMTTLCVDEFTLICEKELSPDETPSTK